MITDVRKLIQIVPMIIGMLLKDWSENNYLIDIWHELINCISSQESGVNLRVVIISQN